MYNILGMDEKVKEFKDFLEGEADGIRKYLLEGEREKIIDRLLNLANMINKKIDEIKKNIVKVEYLDNEIRLSDNQGNEDYLIIEENEFHYIDPWLIYRLWEKYFNEIFGNGLYILTKRHNDNDKTYFIFTIYLKIDNEKKIMLANGKILISDKRIYIIPSEKVPKFINDFFNIGSIIKNFHVKI